MKVIPLEITRAKNIKLSEVPKYISAIDVQGRKIKIDGIFSLIWVTGAGHRIVIFFIVCDLPKEKEALLNVEALISPGVLPSIY